MQHHSHWVLLLSQRSGTDHQSLNPDLVDYGVLVRPTLSEWSEGGHDRVMLRKLDIDNIRVISSILGQSIALDHYAKKVEARHLDWSFWFNNGPRFSSRTLLVLSPVWFTLRICYPEKVYYICLTGGLLILWSVDNTCHTVNPYHDHNWGALLAGWRDGDYIQWVKQRDGADRNFYHDTQKPVSACCSGQHNSCRCHSAFGSSWKVTTSESKQVFRVFSSATAAILSFSFWQ